MVSPARRSGVEVNQSGCSHVSPPHLPLALLPDGRLFSGGEDYVGSFVFDPKRIRPHLWVGTKDRTLVLISYINGKLYSSGYPAGPLYVYDPGSPWTVYKGGPPGQPAPDRTAQTAIPENWAPLVKTRGLAIAHSSALGADSKLYFGGFGERNYTGGGFGWYDPKAGQFGGFWKPLSGYAVQWAHAGS